MKDVKEILKALAHIDTSTLCPDDEEAITQAAFWIEEHREAFP